MSVSIFPEGEIRVFVGSGSTIHRWMRLGPKLKMGEKKSRKARRVPELLQFPSQVVPISQNIRVFCTPLLISDLFLLNFQ
eukprot:COSAG02_NODE_338_length_24206_cov_94.612685_17_plen_80_part_00